MRLSYVGVGEGRGLHGWVDGGEVGERVVKDLDPD